MSIQKKMWSVGILLVLALAVYAVGIKVTPVTTPHQDTVMSDSESNAPLVGKTELANPASVNCVSALGGTLEIRDEENGQVGYCHLGDGRVCEEWALFRDGSCVVQEQQ